MALLWWLALPALSVLLLFWYINGNFGYWRKRGVPFVKPNLFFGNARGALLTREHSSKTFARLYNELKGHDYGGIFYGRTPYLLVRNPEMVKTILVKDFHHFTDRGFHVNFERDPLVQHLFNMNGSHWKQLRNKLTPTFTSGKMKAMFGLIEECSRNFSKILEDIIKRDEEVDIKQVSSKFTMDVIGTCAFGVQCNSMKEEEGEFLKMAGSVFKPSTRQTVSQSLLLGFPDLLQSLPLKIVQQKVEDFFMNVVKEMIQHRKRNKVERNDFLQLLMKIQDDTESNDGADDGLDSLRLTDQLLTAQCFVFFIAGYETSSTTMSFCLTELAIREDVQDKLRAEILTVLKKHDNKLTYDAIMDMHYLDMVVCETLRKNPPVSFLIRECTEPYRLPGSDCVLEKGSRLIVPVYALQHDPQYFPDPKNFDPERFNEKNKAARHHYVYLPFGEGPRVCIGMRFGVMQVKIGLVAMLSKFKVSLCRKSRVPIQMDPRSLISAQLGGTWLRVSPV